MPCTHRQLPLRPPRDIHAHLDSSEMHLAAYAAPSNAADLDAIMVKLEQFEIAHVELMLCRPQSLAAHHGPSASKMTPPSLIPMMPSSSASLPHPASSYMGAVLSTMGGGSLSLLPVLHASTTPALATIILHLMAPQCNRPCRRPGCGHQPCAQLK
jgi:hypothetical protein